MSVQSKHISSGWRSFLAYRARRLTGIQTGLAALDRILLGLSGIVVIQGAPGCNKSTLALQFASYQASSGNPVLIVDRENGKERFRTRLLCQANRIDQVHAFTCSESELKGYVDRVRSWPIYVETDPVREVALLKAMLDEMAVAHPGRPLLLVVDSLQALPALDAEERLSLQLWLKELDQLKLDYDGRLTIVATSEKRRGEAGIEYDRASLGAGKGAGAIEYKAEMVLDLRRRKDDGNIVCEVVKNRDGLSGTSVDLRPMLADPKNSQSFCFRLEAA